VRGRSASRGRLALAGSAVGLAAVALAGAPGGVPPVSFELAEPAGLRFVTNPSRTENRHQPETMVAGIALLDFDNDGWLDVYAVNGARMPSLVKESEAFHNRLFRNLGDGTFRDVTAQAGVAGRGYDQGVTVGDYDADGFQDVFVLGLRQNILFRNKGDGTFEDATVRAGLSRDDTVYGRLWSVAAAFFDYDRDGRLDLFVSNYCVWDPATEPYCGVGSARDYCHPKHYKGLPNSLFRNRGDGTFEDVSAAAGIRKHIGKGMGIAVADYDDDGWPDVFVANDTEPASLFRNRGDGTFREVALEAGVAYVEPGRAVSGMGADGRDLDNDGKPDIFMSAMTRETMPFYKNMGGFAFEERTSASGLGALTHPRAGWSLGVYDFNNDGWKDIFVAGGDVMDLMGSFADQVPQANGLFLNLGNGRFSDGGVQAGAAFASKKAVHRGAAFGDIDNDGRIDAMVTDLHGPLEVWRNTTSGGGHWLSLLLVGNGGNRDAIGAKIRVSSDSGVQHNDVRTSVGYGCASDRRVHFGLGKDAVAKEVRIVWPRGAVQTLNDVPADQHLVVREP
jgi:hypothetical protein